MVSGGGEVLWMEYLGQEASHGLEEVNEGGSFATSGNFFFYLPLRGCAKGKAPKIKETLVQGRVGSSTKRMLDAQHMLWNKCK